MKNLNLLFFLILIPFLGIAQEKKLKSQTVYYSKSENNWIKKEKNHFNVEGQMTHTEYFEKDEITSVRNYFYNENNQLISEIFDKDNNKPTEENIPLRYKNDSGKDYKYDVYGNLIEEYNFVFEVNNNPNSPKYSILKSIKTYDDKNRITSNKIFENDGDLLNLTTYQYLGNKMVTINISSFEIMPKPENETDFENAMKWEKTQTLDEKQNVVKESRCYLNEPGYCFIETFKYDENNNLLEHWVDSDHEDKFYVYQYNTNNLETYSALYSKVLLTIDQTFDDSTLLYEIKTGYENGFITLKERKSRLYEENVINSNQFKISQTRYENEFW